MCYSRAAPGRRWELSLELLGTMKKAADVLSAVVLIPLFVEFHHCA